MYPRFKKTTWYNRNTNMPVYGIKAQLNFHGPWLDMAEDCKPCLFDTEKERDEKLSRLRIEARTNSEFSNTFSLVPVAS